MLRFQPQNQTLFKMKEEIKLRANEIIAALLTMPKLMGQLYGKGKKYDDLIREILKCNYPDGGSLKLPSSKELQQRTKLSPATCKAYLEQIYYGILEQLTQEEIRWEIKNIKCEFWVKGYATTGQLFFMNLPVLPRIGESMQIGFLRPILGTEFFTVHEVRHVLRDDEQFIEVELSSKDFNLFTRLLDDKSKFEGTYDWITQRRGDSTGTYL